MIESTNEVRLNSTKKSAFYFLGERKKSYGKIFTFFRDVCLVFFYGDIKKVLEKEFHKVDAQYFLKEPDELFKQKIRLDTKEMKIMKKAFVDSGAFSPALEKRKPSIFKIYKSAMIWHDLKKIPQAQDVEIIKTICLNYHSLISRFSDEELIEWAKDSNNEFIRTKQYLINTILFVNFDMLQPNQGVVLQRTLGEYGVIVKDYSEQGNFDEAFKEFDKENLEVIKDAVSYVENQNKANQEVRVAV